MFNTMFSRFQQANARERASASRGGGRGTHDSGSWLDASGGGDVSPFNERHAIIGIVETTHG